LLRAEEHESEGQSKFKTVFMAIVQEKKIHNAEVTRTYFMVLTTDGPWDI
jgi:hypothetical protein